MREVIQLNFIGSALLVILTIFLVFNPVMDKRRKRLFLIDVAIIFTMMVCNAQHYMFVGNPNHIVDLKIFSAISYTVSGPVILPIIGITGAIQKKYRRGLTLLAVINTILCFSSIFNGWVFSYDAGGNISYGERIFIPFAFALIYLLVLFNTSLKKLKMGYHGEALVLGILACLVIIATYMNNVLDYKYLVSGMSVVSLLIYYLFFNIQVYTRYALTGALNRHTFYTDIKRAHKDTFYIISLDLNGLKELNDNYGHIEGDKAIMSVSEAAVTCMIPGTRFYRMGGDEFAAICHCDNETEVRRFILALKDEVKKQGYNVAAGYELCRPDDDLKNVILSADQRMYADKADMKGAENIRR